MSHLGSNDIVDFEDCNFDKLVENFIKKNRGLWEHFVIDEYAEECYRVNEAISDDRDR